MLEQRERIGRREGFEGPHRRGVPADGKNFEQEFPVTLNAHLGPGNHFKFTEQGKPGTLEEGRDFVPFNFSGATPMMVC